MVFPSDESLKTMRFSTAGVDFNQQRLRDFMRFLYYTVDHSEVWHSGNDAVTLKYLGICCTYTAECTRSI